MDTFKQRSKDQEFTMANKMEANQSANPNFNIFFLICRNVMKTIRLFFKCTEITAQH